MKDYKKLGVDNVEMDYRELRGIVNKTHDRFSELNFDESLSLLQKVNLLAEHFKTVLKDFQIVVDYLDEFIEEFDVNLYNTLDEVLNEWLKEGKLKDIFEGIWGGEFNDWFNEVKKLLGNDLAYDLVMRVTFLELNARMKYEKITSNDLETGNDKDKIQLINLSEEVIKAIKGTSTNVPPVLIKHSVLRNHLANESVGVEKIAPKGDLAETSTIYDDKLIIGYNVDTSVQLSDNTEYSVMKITLPNTGIINIPYIGNNVLTSGQFIFVGDKDGKRTYMRACRDKLDVVRKGWEIVKIFGNDYIRINKKHSPLEDRFIWLTYKKEDINKIGIISEGTHQLSDFKFLAYPLEDMFFNGETLLNKIDGDIDIFSRVSKFENKLLNGYDVETKKVAMIDDSDCFVSKIIYPKTRTGKVRIFYKDIKKGHQVFIGDSNEKYITSINSNNFPNLNRKGWTVNKELEYFEIDFEQADYNENIIYFSSLKEFRSYSYVFVTGRTSLMDVLTKDDTQQLHNVLANDVNLLDSLDVFKNKVLNGYNIETYKVNMIDSQYNNVYKFNYPNNQTGKVRFYYELATTGHQVYIGDKDGSYITSINKNNFNTLNRVGWFVNSEENYFEIDFEKTSQLERVIYFSLPITAISKAYVNISAKTYLLDVLHLDFKNELKTKLEFISPNTINIFKNTSSLIYFDNFIFGDINRNYYRNVSMFCNSNNRENGFLVKSENSNKIDLTMIDNQIELNKSFNIRVVNPPVERKKVLIIGESTIDNSKSPFVLDELMKISKANNDNIELLGTRGDGLLKHEARSGWGIGAYRYLEKRQEGNSPTTINSFYDVSLKRFDYASYLDKYSIPQADIVIFHILINPDNRFVENITNDPFYKHYDFIIENILKTNPNTKFIIDTSSTISRNNNTTPNVERENIMSKNKQLISYYENREDENIFVGSSHLFIDPINDYPTNDINVDEYNSNLIEKITTDGTHPNEYGQRKLGKRLFTDICYVINKDI